jgi:hypothetical protein
MKRLTTLILLSLVSICILAQAPGNLSYQAIVRDSNGKLVSSHDVGIRISILQGSANGSSVFAESHLTQTNINGLISIEIGSGTLITGGFPTIDWSAGPYFLKTETDPSGGTSYTITGIVQLLSVPYSLFAQSAENGFALKYSDTEKRPILYDSGNIGIGIPEMNFLGVPDNNYKLSVNGPVDILPGNVTWGAGMTLDASTDTGGVSFLIYSLSKNAREGAGKFLIRDYGGNSIFLMDNKGHIGLNNDFPAYNLDISGDINFTGKLYHNGNLFSDSISWNGIINKPSTVSGFGITDAISTTASQTITGNKTFNGTVTVPSPVNATDAVNKAFVTLSVSATGDTLYLGKQHLIIPGISAANH